jgi:pullulanase
MVTKADILDRKQTHFVLWRPTTFTTAPKLVLGELTPGNPPKLTDVRHVPMTIVKGLTGLWEIAATECQLTDGRVYHYWFEVQDSSAGAQPKSVVGCTDPIAFAVDWRLFPPDTSDNPQPAAVVKREQGRLQACDPGGEVVRFKKEAKPDSLPANSRLVIYELPTAWAMSRALNENHLDLGTFQDVRALVDETVGGANFHGLNLLRPGYSYLCDLGVNALELLPPADSSFKTCMGL